MVFLVEYKNMKKILGIVLLIIVLVALYNRFKPLPNGISEKWESHYVPGENISFIYDETYVNKSGERFVNQNIFDEVMSMIDRADKYILIDMFLFNNFQGENIEDTRLISSELTQKLIDKSDDVAITFITDPINSIYGGIEADNLKRLEEAGVNVVITDLTDLRDSNIIYSTFWRLGLRYLPLDFIKLSNPFAENPEKVGLNSFIDLLNLKANHRKLIVADQGDKMITLVTSANPHDGSSAHGNVALRVEDKIWRDVLDSEVAIGNFSDDEVEDYTGDVRDENGGVEVRLITEGEIRRSVIDNISMTSLGDNISIGMFYLSEKRIVRELVRASKRGVNIRVILDPNKDAFGKEKNGIPNRVVANDLIKAGVELRWCDTHGEQCHGKMMLISDISKATLILGSANYTRRNIKDFNLETNIIVKGTRNYEVFRDAESYFSRLWNNEGGRIYTVEAEEYTDKSLVKRATYNVMEITGLSSF